MFKNCFLLLLFVPLVGCASLDLPKYPIREEIRQVALSEDYSFTGSDYFSDEELSLEDLVEIVIRQNPRLKAAYDRFEAKINRIPQARSLPDPRVSYTQFVEGVQTRTGEQEFIASVSQTFPWFGKRKLRGSIAQAEAMASLEEYRVLMLDLVKEIESVVYQLWYEREVFKLLEEERASFLQAVQVSNGNYASGQGSRLTVLMAQTQVAKIENEIQIVPMNIRSLESKLSLLADLDLTIENLKLDDLDITTETWDMEQLLSNAFTNRPELEGAMYMVEREERNLSLIRKDDYPDLTFGVNYIGIGGRPDNPAIAPGDEGDDAWGVSIGFNIPIPNARRRAAKLEAQRRLSAARFDREAREDQVMQEVRWIVPRISGLTTQLKILENSVEPLAQQALDTSRSGYEVGRTSYLDFLEAERTLIDIREDKIRLQKDLYLSFTELERAIGSRLVGERKDLLK